MTKYKYGDPEAPIVLIQPVGDHDLPEIEGEVAQIRKLTALDFQMIAVKVDDWNLDLSPWKAPAVFGNEDFGEGAASLLEEILRLCSDESKTYYLGGYSLAGVFSVGILSDGSVCGDSGGIALGVVPRVSTLYERTRESESGSLLKSGGQRGKDQKSCYGYCG